MSYSLILLAGGRSSRMGRDKAMLEWNGKTFLRHALDKGEALGITDILVSGYRGDDCPYPVIPDLHPLRGPLGGIEACMRRAKHEKCLILTVDVPRLSLSALQTLLSAAECSTEKAVILRHGDRYEPLLSVLDVSLLPEIEDEALHGSGALMRVLRRTGYALCDVPEDGGFENVNDPESYRRLCAGETERTVAGRGTVADRTVYALRDGAWHKQTLTLIEEARLTVTVNGEAARSILCSPCALREMLVGRLFADGVIDSAGDILSLTLDADAMTAEVTVAPHEKAVFPPVKPIPWESAWIERMAQRLNCDTPIYQRSKSAHSCQLMRNGELLCCMEDISRHNALDKVLGFALLHGIPTEECAVFSSGRIPVDAVEKLCRARIPVAASKAMPTASAVTLAEAHGITLLHLSPYFGLLRLTEA